MKNEHMLFQMLHSQMNNTDYLQQRIAKEMSKIDGRLSIIEEDIADLLFQVEACLGIAENIA